MDYINYTGLIVVDSLTNLPDLKKIYQTLIYQILGLGPLGKVKVSKPISRGAAVIGLLEFLLGIGLLVAGILLVVKDVNNELDVSEDPKFYGLWSSPGVETYFTLLLVAITKSPSKFLPSHLV